MKILGIGYSRTGTTSLSKALQILGFDVVHQCPIQHGNYIWNDICDDLVTSDGIVSSSLARYYKRLDMHYPKSKFILTTRNEADWRNSLRIFCPTSGFNIKTHENEVCSYFNTRFKDLLVINICSDRHEWKKLCEFLDCEQPDIAFPWENKYEMAK